MTEEEIKAAREAKLLENRKKTAALVVRSYGVLETSEFWLEQDVTDFDRIYSAMSEISGEIRKRLAERHVEAIKELGFDVKAKLS